MNESRSVRKLRHRVAGLGLDQVTPHPRKPPGRHELQWRLAAMPPERMLEVAVADTGYCAQAAEVIGCVKLASIHSSTTRMRWMASAVDVDEGRVPRIWSAIQPRSSVCRC